MKIAICYINVHTNKRNNGAGITYPVGVLEFIPVF